MGHYDGCSLSELDRLQRKGKLSATQSLYRDWERLFVKLKPTLAPSRQYGPIQ